MNFKIKKIKKALQEASDAQAKYCVIIGEDEINKKSVKLKNMHTRESEDVELSVLLKKICVIYNKP